MAVGYYISRPKLGTIVKSISIAMLCASAIVPSTVSASVIDKPYFKANSIVIVFGADDFEENGGVAPVVYDFYLLDDATPDTEALDLIGADGRTINYNTQSYNPIQSGSASGWEFQINDATSGGVFNSSAPHQTLDANDSYTAFGLDNDTDIDLLGGGARASRFFVASNTPFDVYGHATNLVTSGDFSSLDYTNIRYRLRYQVNGGGGVNRWGDSAQDPAIGGLGVIVGQDSGPLFTLDDISAGPTKVFDGGQRTAASEGSIMSHAVSFQSRYNLLGAAFGSNGYDFSLGTGAISADIVYTIYTP